MPLPRSGPIEELDLRAAIEQLVAATPGIVSVHLFGSRVHRTQSLRSDIDLLVSGQGLSPAKMNLLQARISPYLDVFVVAGATAISAANQSTIPAATTLELYEKTSAEELWRGEWVGAEDLVAQDILRNYAPVPTFALVGAELLSVDAVDYLFVTALPMEYQAAVDAVGDMTVGDGEGRLVRHHFGTIGPPGSEKNVAVVLLPTIGMVAAALTTQQLVGSMDVGTVLLVGITGAIQEDGVSLGDLVIPRSLFDYEAAKATAVGDRLNPTIVPVPRPLYQRVRTFDFASWAATASAALPRVSGKRPRPTVHLDRTMACGTKVIADRDRALLLQDTDRKTLAIEMESLGVAEACGVAVPPREYLVIKGITDWADAEKNDLWHRYACAASSRLAVDLIREGVF